jgi:pantoate--beta-alanine ligase
MLIFRTVEAIQSWITYQKSVGNTIGFVPTMGALHPGHISLIEQSKNENDLTVCSIFVNPTQFNDPKDLEKYPRTLEADSELLCNAHCEVLFYPSVDEIYPNDMKIIFVDLQGLDQVMEGLHRPGHFNGVVQVVHRLLDIVKPGRLYMGQKDFQQFSIIGHMIDALQLSVKLVVCPISREINGLAMSSRNMRLSSEGRQVAAEIFKTISQAHDLKKNMTPAQVSSFCYDALNHEPFKPEYIDIVDTKTLKPLKVWGADGTSVICAAVWLEGVRLIDNIII